MKRILLFAISLLCCILTNAQTKGIVMDGDRNEPFLGVDVMKKGSAIGTITGGDGSFSINAGAGDTLVFSFIGYKTVEHVVAGLTGIVITMHVDQNLLDEVVVVGYGVQKKSDVTGAISSINSKKLEEHPQVNVIQSLQGTVAGLNISMTGSNAEGSSSSTVIRGGNSITASNKPLIILDGIPFNGAWSEINPNDVESIEVLKDASSAAIYGARGANGVILIQTKRGKQEKVVLSYDGFVSISNAINIPKMMDGETFYNRKAEAGGDFTFTENKMHEAGKSTNWLDLALRQGFNHQHNVSLRGSGKTSRYYISGSFADNKGISVNDNFRRITFRINFEQEIAPWFKVGTNTQYGYYDRSGNEANFDKAFLMNPLGEPYEENGDLRLQTWEDNNYAKNPLSPLNEKNNDVTDRITTNNYVDITFMKGLTYKLNTGYTYDSRLYQNYQGRDTYDGSKANGILEVSNTYNRDWIIENILSFNRTFGKHSLFLTALYSAQGEKMEMNKIDAQGFPNDVMGYYQPDKASSLKATTSQITKNHVSQMFRANYAYDSRYLFTATVRRDGYSAFGADKKYGVFPSVALGWNIINESFMENTGFNSLFNNLKIRASWGRNGNEAISAYATLPSLLSMDYLTDDHIPAFGFYPSKLSSPALGWETTSSFNVGVDFALLKDRIRGSIEYYNTQTKDLLLNRTIPSVNGTSLILENVGKTKGQGIEFQISSVNISRKNFTWSTDFNIVHNSTRLVDVGLYDQNGKPIDDIASGWYIGYPVSVNYDYIFDGIYQVADMIPGKTLPFNSQPGFIRYKDLDGNGEIKPQEDQEIIGSRQPKFTFGLNNVFNIGNFTVALFLNGSYGITMPNYLKSVHTLSYRENQLDKEFWSEDNPINTYPKNVADGSVNPARMYFYEKADFLRIKDLSVAYRFPSGILDKIRLSRLEVYVNARNLYTFTNWSGLDPEFISSGSRQRAIPQTREFVFGLRFDF